MDRAASLRLARTIALAVPLLLLGGAYLSEYAFGLVPCEMCWWQRYAHFAALPFAALAYVRRDSAVPAALAALAIAGSAVIGAFHTGVEYHWWQGLTACTAPTGSLEDLFKVPIVRCDAVQWSLLGISMAGWNFLISLAAVLAVWLLLLRGRKGAV